MKAILGRFGAVKFAAAVALSLVTTTTLACSCAFDTLNDETVRTARNVFVFQVTLARVTLEDGDISFNRRLETEIRVVDKYRGDNPPDRVSYSTAQCCGTRLDVGHFYGAFIDDVRGEVWVNPGNLLHLGDSYPKDSYQAAEFGALMSGATQLEDEYGPFPSSRQSQVPPPPCPPLPTTERVDLQE